jgi:hypothetical protein
VLVQWVQRGRRVGSADRVDALIAQRCDPLLKCALGLRWTNNRYSAWKGR